MAQTAAAIVAIVGGLMASRILDQIGKTQSYRETLPERIKELVYTVKLGSNPTFPK